MSYYHVCPDCGAALDPGERCDCQDQEGAESEPSRNQNKTAADAANIDDGTVEKGLPTNFSTSNDN